METTLTKSGYEAGLNDYVKQERAAVDLINSVGSLMYDKGVELVLFRNHLVNVTISEVIDLVGYAENVVNKPIDLYTSAEVARAMLKLDLAPSKIDIGKLTKEYIDEKSSFASINDFLNNKLAGFIGQDKHTFNPKDVVLYGFGRIGRLVVRELIKQAGKGQQLRLKAVVLRKVTADDLVKRASLLSNDSVHNAFKGSVDVDTENLALIINGQMVKFIQASNPEDVDYTTYGIDDALLIDSTGVFKDREALSRHTQAKGVSKVLLTAPGAGIPNIVYGINHKELDLEGENIFSAASCTTNCISPVLKVIEDNFGVEKGHIETIHAYTNDQNLLDNFHKKPRRGRSAAINMVITSTGAGKAVTKVIPSLDGKLTANAVRVPTPNGSLAIMNLSVSKETSVEEVNNKIREAALEGELVNQINYQINPELVSNDIIGNTCASVFDSNATIVSNDGKTMTLYAWYDNEFGYTKQVIRLAKYIAKVRRLIYY
ncbi:glyceraldehyde-3-phosphate dehydrogenase [Parvicella tangerina]|uniref:Glyceraldehyde-3-phosphate dehydrogenase n=1 Tax=Parvicella tangerina TaxID=2829795 RepID=A0A916JQJ3_9FLAO|nr:glyceraldehyde-3-phosphate dehydrogenase [Parvicella tangerina]CAG5084747.1 Glyceraldehyde-3-phosphate dehydrogenase-like protein [Parvicella tangerina]